jgi:hypothetical protein
VPEDKEQLDYEALRNRYSDPKYRHVIPKFANRGDPFYIRIKLRFLEDRLRQADETLDILEWAVTDGHSDLSKQIAEMLHHVEEAREIRERVSDIMLSRLPSRAGPKRV